MVLWFSTRPKTLSKSFHCLGPVQVLTVYASMKASVRTVWVQNPEEDL